MKSAALWSKVFAWVGVIGGLVGNAIEFAAPFTTHDYAIWFFLVGNLVATYLGFLGLRLLAKEPQTGGRMMLLAAALGFSTAFQWYAVGAAGFLAAAVLAYRTPVQAEGH